MTQEVAAKAKPAGRQAEEDTPLKPEATDDQITLLELDIKETLNALHRERRKKNRPGIIKELEEDLASYKAQAISYDLGKPKKATLEMFKSMVNDHRDIPVHAAVNGILEAAKKADVSMADLTNEDNGFTVTVIAKCVLEPGGGVRYGKSTMRVGPTQKKKAKKVLVKVAAA